MGVKRYALSKKRRFSKCVPVKDAVTKVAFPEPGEYRVFVRTKNWVARWNAEEAPGKFQVLKGVVMRLYSQSGKWCDIPDSVTTKNLNVDWHCRFPPITIERLRLLVKKTQINVSRIWEIEVYKPESGEK